MPEYQNVTTLETELNQIFQKQDYYDIQKYLHKEAPKQPASQELPQPKELRNSIVFSSSKKCLYEFRRIS